MTPTSKKYIVKLTDDELKRLNKILRQKNTSETVANRIRILKDMDENGKYELRHDALATKIYEQISLVEKEMLEVRQFLGLGLILAGLAVIDGRLFRRR